ncbi:hypothetical protein RchiOBHm_Chr5g0001661 [Rosa chinensis]|uniref:Uncharacterized protein n=1 Tax=Rosa chinensis TaxID=74649 RepID=A0A2P6Q2B0_ROSCH|nr:uncharacterized protein LOC112165677 [Rosa chinensis]PRQ28307.1 hypothetical protein RchiOBHm_Chr5g0001661 [Rosa chinensis]
MEGVGARTGRTSTRYGPATVFNGPVRKWKKKWVHVAPPPHHTSHSHQINAHNHSNGTTPNGNNGSHLLLFKWAPITQSQNAAAANGSAATNYDKVDEVEEPPRRRFKYIPIALLEEQQNEAAEQVEEEANLIDTETAETEATAKDEGLVEKPDINDVPMEENQDNNQVVCQDLNESTLDLSLGLNGHDSDDGSAMKTDQTRKG